MNTLVFGGTRYFGIHLVNKLLDDGHNVTIATRGHTADAFGSRVKRVIVERTDSNSIHTALHGKDFETIIDNMAYSSDEVRFVLEAMQPDRYILTSSASVYEKWHENMLECETDTLAHPLKWCSREDFEYGEIKRQAECALFQAYPNLSSAAVRFPLVIGGDDYTKRLYFYVEHVVKSLPMYVDNPDARIGLINSKEAGHFLAWLALNEIQGSVNAGSTGTVSLAEVIRRAEARSKKKALLDETGEAAPLNGADSFSLNTSKAESAGFKFMKTEEWVYPLIDLWVDELLAEVK